MKKLIFLVFGLWVAVGMAQEGKEPGINEFVFAEAEPLPVNLTDIIKEVGYPEEAVNQSIQGDVVVRILIDEQGNYIKHSFIKEVHPSLTAAVEAHISELTFTPALQGGKPIKYWTNIRFPFKLLESQRDPREVAVEVLTEHLATDSTDYQAFLKRGIQYRDLNQLDKAIADFDTSLKLNPAAIQPKPVEPPAPEPKKKKRKKKGAPPPPPPPPAIDTLGLTYMFYAYYARGTALSLKQAHQEAIDDMIKAIEVVPEIPEPDSALVQAIANVYMERGFAYANLEQYDKALEDYEWVIENSSEMACNVHQLVADIYLNRKDYASLVKTYDDMIGCQPNSPLLYYSRGYYKTETGDYEGAIADFEKMLEDSKIVNLNIAANNRIGWAYMKMEKYDEAFAGIQKALDINVLNPQAYFYRGLVYEAKGENDAACKAALKASSYGMEGPEVQALSDLLTRLGCEDEGE